MSHPASVTYPQLGFACAIGAQLVWGFFPLFYKLLDSIVVFDLVAHRAVWALTMMVTGLIGWAIVTWSQPAPVREIKSAFANRKLLLLIVAAAALISVNWISFVWAVTHERAQQASLGYYICPQVNVLLGVLVLGERLSKWQWMAVGLAALGVLYISFFSSEIPIVSLIMASSFGLYGLVKKKIGITAIPGLTLEIALLAIPAIAWFSYRAATNATDAADLFGETRMISALLVLSGLMTATPLLLYATALKHIPLSTAGLLQFIGPTLQFFSSVFLLNEPFDRNKLIGFIFVWIGLVIFLYTSRPRQTLPAVPIE